jgi:hypothetical protein
MKRPVASVRASGLLEPGRRFVDLVGLSERRLREAFGGRVARVYGWGIAVSYVAALFVVKSRAEAILEQALVALAWIPAGLVALGAARDQAHLDDEQGFVALVRQRGFAGRELEPARFLAAARRIAKVTGYPALVLVLGRAALARDTNAALTAVASAAGAAIFVLCLSFLLAGVARASAIVSGGRGRFVFVAVVLVPHIARALFPDMPSVPRLLGSLLDAFFGSGEA